MKNGKCPIRAAIGQLRWATRTRPDILYPLSVVSSCVESPTNQHVAQINKLIRRVQQSDITIRCPVLKGDLQIVSICDSSFQNRENSKSQGAYMTFITEKSNDIC